MPRPLNQGETAVRRDVDTLLRISRRISEDTDRKPKERDEIVAHLDAAVTALLSGKRTGQRRTGRAA
jgi:hypothetical protein